MVQGWGQRSTFQHFFANLNLIFPIDISVGVEPCRERVKHGGLACEFAVVELANGWQNRAIVLLWQHGPVNPPF
jgi:hypothetical protein